MVKSLVLSLVAIWFVAISGQLIAQEQPALQLPECDIFLFDLKNEADSFQLSNVRNITNRPGYDNQPWFTADSQSIVYTANGKPDRTDVFEYFVDSQETKQVTDTPNQEYSPQSSPDNQSISFVTDGETANQSVWIADRATGNETWLLENQGQREPVGYYSWNRKTDHILYWSRYGFAVQLVKRDGSMAHYVTGNAPPSTPHIIPGTDLFSFLHRQDNGQIWLKELNPETLAVRPLTAISGSNNNYCWTPRKQVLMIIDDKLNLWSEADGDWKEVAQLESFGIQNGTRLMVSPDGKKLAVVGLPLSDSD